MVPRHHLPPPIPAPAATPDRSSNHQSQSLPHPPIAHLSDVRVRDNVRSDINVPERPRIARTAGPRAQGPHPHSPGDSWAAHHRVHLSDARPCTCQTATLTCIGVQSVINCHLDDLVPDIKDSARIADVGYRDEVADNDGHCDCAACGERRERAGLLQSCCQKKKMR